MIIRRCCQGLVARAQRDGEPAAERERKAIWVPVAAAVCPLTLANLVQLHAPPPQARFFTNVLLAAAPLAGLLWPLLTRRLPIRFIEAVLCTTALGLITADLNAAAGNHAFRPWTFGILVMDLLLALDASWRPQLLVMAILTVWVAVSSMEGAWSLGLYHIEGFSREAEDAAKVCECAEPPCAGGHVYITYFLPATLIVLYLDFYATRGFAEGLRRKQERIEASVRVSARVAALLAAYATDDAREVVAEVGDALPEGLRTSYVQLLANLDAYRAFLPDALLSAALLHKQQQQRSDSVKSGTEAPTAARMSLRPAPGYGQDTAHVAVCFTDIQSSTELWESHPQGMYVALNTHNVAMRDVYAECNGYEVKTIGDSFMVAFDTGIQAVRFGLRVQLRLLEQRWPDDILSHPLCQRVITPAGTLLWGGLRVRVAVQSGPAQAQRNPVTGRYDYFGRTVNTAARLEAAVRWGGLVSTTEAVIDEMGVVGLQELDSPVSFNVGSKELKGLKERVGIVCLVPRALRGRLGLLSSDSPMSTTEERPRGPGWSKRRSERISLSLSRSSRGSVLTGSSSTPPGPASRRLSPGPLGYHSGSKSQGPVTLQKRSGQATCATVRAALHEMEPLAERIIPYIAAVCLAADRTQGVVEAVQSACATVSWNATHPCADHTACCRRFMRSSFKAPSHLGAASGPVLFGNLPAGRRSFSTVVGSCVDLSAALAEEAQRCGDLALAAGAVADDCAAAGVAFCAQLWVALGQTSIVVWEVVGADDDDEEEKWLLDSSHRATRDSCLWAGAVSEEFLAACAEEPGSAQQVALLQKLKGQSDPAKAVLADRLASGHVRTRLMPPQWHGGPLRILPAPMQSPSSSGCGFDSL